MTNKYYSMGYTSRMCSEVLPKPQGAIRFSRSSLTQLQCHAIIKTVGVLPSSHYHYSINALQQGGDSNKSYFREVC